MIHIDVNKSQLSIIEKALGDMKNKTPNVMKKALNDTAVKARKDLADKSKIAYAVKKANFNKSMKIQKATVGSQEAIIRTSGEALELGDYKVSPSSVAIGTNRPAVVKGKVLNSSSMKALKTSTTKAFVARFKSGHEAVVQRVPGKKMKSNPRKEFLRKLLSPSIPQMIGNEQKVYGEVQPLISNYLQESIQKQISITLGV